MGIWPKGFAKYPVTCFSSINGASIGAWPRHANGMSYLEDLFVPYTVFHYAQSLL
jgi:hypothetical protein